MKITMCIYFHINDEIRHSISIQLPKMNWFQNEAEDSKFNEYKSLEMLMKYLRVINCIIYTLDWIRPSIFTGIFFCFQTHTSKQQLQCFWLNKLLGQVYDRIRHTFIQQIWQRYHSNVLIEKQFPINRRQALRY